MKGVAKTALAVAILALAGACQGHPGRVLVVVDSDYSVPAELLEVRVLAGPVDDPEDRMGQAFVLTGFDPAPTGLYHLPLSLAVVPRDGDSNRRVEIVVEGRSAASGDVLVRTTRILEGFRSGDTVVLPVFLTRDCQGRVCGAGLTCIDGECEGSSIDPGDLRIAQDPGEELRGVPDAAVMDSGVVPTDAGADTEPATDSAMDASTDASIDGSTDAAPTDAAPPDVGPVDTGVPDAGPCGAPVTLDYTVILGADTLFPLDGGAGEWAYTARLRDFDTYVEWDVTAPLGCEIWRVEAALPPGDPVDPHVACSGTCATARSTSAYYEIYLDGDSTLIQLEERNQQVLPDVARIDITTPARRVKMMLSDWSGMGPYEEHFIVFHTAEFFMRPTP